jgi:hypothetical protein
VSIFCVFVPQFSSNTWVAYVYCVREEQCLCVVFYLLNNLLSLDIIVCSCSNVVLVLDVKGGEFYQLKLRFP